MRKFEESTIETYGKLIVGFDMAQEEDSNVPLCCFVEQLARAQKEKPFNYYMHAGESILRQNYNLYEAILLGCKRIGHGFNLGLHPHLIELVKEKDICIECCPCSNVILGYVTDLRCHPVRSLLH